MNYITWAQTELHKYCIKHNIPEPTINTNQVYNPKTQQMVTEQEFSQRCDQLIESFPIIILLTWDTMILDYPQPLPIELSGRAKLDLDPDRIIFADEDIILYRN